MKDVYHISSDSENMEELLLGTRNRRISQKFIYFGKGASFFYSYKEINKVEVITNEDYYKFGLSNNLFNDTNSAIISLGCGNSLVEKYILEKSKNKIDYFGVDSSFEMLELSIGNLEKNNLNSRFICADFSTVKFRLELDSLTKKYSRKTFLFFSNTFGNIRHTDIIDILSNLLNKGDRIWLDVRLRPGTNIEDDIKLSEVYSKDLKREQMVRSYFSVLKDSGADINDFQLIMETEKEEVIKALIFNFYFLVKNKTKISIKGDEIILLPKERLRVQSMYTYDASGLINFFNQHGFKIIDSKEGSFIGQFLFEKC